MAKADKATAVAAEQPVQSAGSEPLHLTEYCRRLSEKVRSPELIGAFYRAEQAANRVRATAEEFDSRFATFTKKPV